MLRQCHERIEKRPTSGSRFGGARSRFGGTSSGCWINVEGVEGGDDLRNKGDVDGDIGHGWLKGGFLEGGN